MKREALTAKKIYSLCFLVIMCILGVFSVLSYFETHSLTETEEPSKKISMKETYPFEEEEIILESPTVLKSIKKYQNTVYKITNKIDQYIKINNPFASQFKSIQDIYSNITYGNLILNGTTPFIKLENGHLVGCFGYCPAKETLNNIKDFSEWLKDSDIPLLMVITPDKADDSITAFPRGIPHAYIQMLEEYKTFLNENGIDYIETKEILLEENEDFYSWFYKTDHHWNVDAAFLMARYTAEYLNNEMQIASDTEILNDDSFESVIYPNSYQGGYGRKLGSAWKEDMKVLYPLEENEFHIEIPGVIDKTGSFENTLIDQSKLSDDLSTYKAFLYGDHPLIQIENNSCDNGSRILVIKYSFANEYCPYLVETIQYLDMIDPRYFDGSIRTYIKETKPDAVIFCMGVVGDFDEGKLDLK